MNGWTIEFFNKKDILISFSTTDVDTAMRKLGHLERYRIPYRVKEYEKSE